MFGCTDTYYYPNWSRTALVLFDTWKDSLSARELAIENYGETSTYVPGEFFRRELPGILSAIKPVQELLTAVIVDGYVWLDDCGRKGLGAILYEALDRRIKIIGVAKTKFAGGGGIEVFRGKSARPLIVTAAGLCVEDAAKYVQSMAGAHRVPTLIRRADHVSRHGLH